MFSVENEKILHWVWVMIKKMEDQDVSFFIDDDRW